MNDKPQSGEVSTRYEVSKCRASRAQFREWEVSRLVLLVRDFTKSFVLNEEIAGLLAIEQVQNEIVDMFNYDFEWIYDEDGNRVCRVTAEQR